MSFFGGGTDLSSYYKSGYGAVLSTTIQKYMYVSLNRRLDDRIRIVYSRLEEVDYIKEIKHDFIREVLRTTQLSKGVEIIISSDIPAKGSGIGSSAATTVGALNVCCHYLNKMAPKRFLAETAYFIENKRLNIPCGKQDQFAVAHGGLNYIQFNPDESVEVYPIEISDARKKELESSLMLFYTDIPRNSKDMLRDTEKNIPEKMQLMTLIRDQAVKMKDLLENNFSVEEFGRKLGEEWSLKKQIAEGITLDIIDEYYEKALDHGAFGGKLCGAGGGGFLLLCCPRECQNEVRKALPLREVELKFDDTGSKIIYRD